MDTLTDDEKMALEEGFDMDWILDERTRSHDWFFHISGEHVHDAIDELRWSMHDGRCKGQPYVGFRATATESGTPVIRGYFRFEKSKTRSELEDLRNPPYAVLHPSFYDLARWFQYEDYPPREFVEDHKAEGAWVESGTLYLSKSRKRDFDDMN